MKLYDFDGMFDEKLSGYVAKNSGKYKENEWEDIIPELYKKFGDTPIKSLGKTPREYYAGMSDGEVIKCLKSHLSHGVPVPEFLCADIESRNLVKELLPLLDGTRDEVEYAMNLIGADALAVDKYMQMLISYDDEDMKNRCVDFIKENADLVLKKAVENYRNGVEKEYMLEIMSRIIQRSDEVFDILLKEFRSDPDNVPMHASYLASYGDERALEYLLDKIDEEGISFIEYQELKFAIEALGGEYNKERDFSNDPYYKIIKPNG
ncbi:MAG: hypothetical protein HDQ88_00100 [Clostridia bacterium]|nr:hypothetical protein [Clostridia bacterium]